MGERSRDCTWLIVFVVLDVGTHYGEMSPSLRDIRQEEAVRAFVRLGGVERRGKGSHRVVNMNGRNLSIPHGVLKTGLLRYLIKQAGITARQFHEVL